MSTLGDPSYLRQHLIVASNPGPLLVIFGGVAWADPKFMSRQTPEEVQKRWRCVFAPCYDKHNDFSFAQVLQALAEKRIQPGPPIAVAGFSRGGRPAFSAYRDHNATMNFALAGFIDPSFEEGHLGLAFGPNCVFQGVSRQETEEGGRGMADPHEFRLAGLYPQLQAKIAAGQGTVIVNTGPHRTQPAAFFRDRVVRQKLGIT